MHLIGFHKQEQKLFQCIYYVCSERNVQYIHCYGCTGSITRLLDPSGKLLAHPLSLCA